MKYVKTIYSSVGETSQKVIFNKPIRISLKGEKFTSDTLEYFAKRMKYLKRYSIQKLCIIIDLGEVNFADKVTYLIFDSLLYDIFQTTKFEISIPLTYNVEKFYNSGFQSTALYRCYEKVKSCSINRDIFCREYEKKIYTDKNCYRRYLQRQDFADPLIPSIIMSEVATTLKTHYSYDEQWIDSISEIVSELVCNTISHTDGDCIVDINALPLRNNESGKPFVGLGIAVINYSENRVFDLIKNNIKNKRYNVNDDLYKKVYKAYENHQHFFNESYNEDDFFLITAFQNHVTSRFLDSGSGGTGLTTLIEKIIGKTDSDYSYVLSGNNLLFLRSDFLKIAEGGFIGFNLENNYFDFAPDLSIVNKSTLYVPGTIYHLLLIKEI